MLRQWCFTSEYSRARVEVPVKLKEVGSGVSSTSKELSIARRLNGWIPVCSNAFVTVVRFMLSIAKRDKYWHVCLIHSTVTNKQGLLSFLFRFCIWAVQITCLAVVRCAISLVGSCINGSNTCVKFESYPIKTVGGDRFEKSLTTGQTDGRTDRRTDGRTTDTEWWEKPLLT